MARSNTSSAFSKLFKRIRKGGKVGDVPTMGGDQDKLLERCRSYGNRGGAPPPKKGFMVVYVGEELRRYVIPTRYVSDREFLPVLEMVREEFGFRHDGGLRIPCDVDEFEKILRRLTKKR